jgi:DNA invertase Pin-like site-specific DNA recombinase
MGQFLTGDGVGLLDRLLHHVASEDFNLAIDVFGALAQFEWELVKARTMAGLVAARARGRTGGQPTVMTTAKIRAAQRMSSAGTLLAEVASVLGVGRTMLYRHLEATSPTA